MNQLQASSTSPAHLMQEDDDYLVVYRTKDFYQSIIDLIFRASLFKFAMNIAYLFLNVKKKVK